MSQQQGQRERQWPRHAAGLQLRQEATAAAAAAVAVISSTGVPFSLSYGRQPQRRTRRAAVAVGADAHAGPQLRSAQTQGRSCRLCYAERVSGNASLELRWMAMQDLLQSKRRTWE